MRALMLAAAAACGMAGSASAALVTYQFDITMDSFAYKIDLSYAEGSEPGPGTHTYVPTSYEPRHITHTIILDDELSDLTDNTVSAFTQGYEIGGTWEGREHSRYMSDFFLTLGSAGEVLDYAINRGAWSYSAIFSPTQNKDHDYDGPYAMTPISYWQDRFGPIPEGAVAFYSSELWTASTPGTWTRIDATPVPLPASALLLLAGVGGLVAIRRKRQA